jgi:hypothetical protein
MKYRLLWLGAMAGLLIHFTGLGWDVYRHSADSTLAQREDVLSLTNLSHLMIVAGMSIVAACLMGILAVWMNERNVGGQGLIGNALRSVALPAIAVVSASSIWVASRAEDTGHDHGLAVAHAHEDHSHHPVALDPWIARAIDPASLAALPVDGHTHGPAGLPPSTSTGEDQGNHHAHHDEVSVTADQLIAAAEFVRGVKAHNAQRYENVQDALAAGYIQITGDLPGIAAHFIRLDYQRDGREMDPEYPEVLLYTKRLDGEWRLIGVMFLAEQATEEAPSYFGPLDAWHYHTNLCFRDGRSTTVANAAACPGGAFVARTNWQLHVWIMDGATGAFSHDFAPITPGPFPGATLLAAQELRAQAR